MQVRIFQPPPPVGNYIENLTWYAGYSPDYSHERLLPQGAVELIFDLTEPPKFIYDNQSLAVSQTCRKAWVAGLRQEFITISALPGSSMLVVRFRAGMAFPALRLPLNQLKNQVVDADLLPGNEFFSLRERLVNTATPEEKFEAVVQFFTKRIASQPEIHPAIQFCMEKIEANPSLVTVDWLVRKTGWSQKHLISLFQKFVGTSPKEFVRIARFQKAIEAIGAAPSVDWQRLLHDCGYYDQAHFIRDFRAFSGLSPVHYLSERGEDLNYLPLREIQP